MARGHVCPGWKTHVSWLEDTCVLARRHMCPGSFHLIPFALGSVDYYDPPLRQQQGPSIITTPKKRGTTIIATTTSIPTFRVVVMHFWMFWIWKIVGLGVRRFLLPPKNAVRRLFRLPRLFRLLE